MPPPPQRRSPRARPAATRISCWRRPAPAPARRSATSRPPASGRRRTAAPVWVSTFTRHLQRQIDAEIARLFPDPIQRRRRVVIRKGRENYLCLLNLEDAVGGATTGFVQQQTIPLGLIVRWALATDDGDLQGGDLPGWFAELFGAPLLASSGRPPRRVHPRRLRPLAEMLRRTHHPPRPHRRAGGRQPRPGHDPGGLGRAGRQRRADAATCSTKATTCSTPPTRRSPPPSPATRQPNCAAGCSARRAAGRAPAAWPAASKNWSPSARSWKPRWTPPCRPPARCLRRAGPAGSATKARSLPDSTPAGPIPPRPSCAWSATRSLARIQGSDGEPSRLATWGAAECDVFPPAPELPPAADRLARAFARIAEPLATLRERLLARLDAEAEEMDAATRNRIEAIGRSLTRRALNPLSAWQSMLRQLAAPEPSPGTLSPYVAFFRLDHRPGGRDSDVGLHRHWLDPTVPFAATLAAPAHGLLVTSATLRDASGADPETTWARRRGPGRRAPPAVAGDPRRGRLAVRLRRTDPRLHRARRGRRRHRPARCRLPRPVPRVRRRRARPVHRHPPAAGGARPHRAGAGSRRHPALRPARRRDGQRHPGGHLPHRGIELPARHRRDARWRGRARPRAAPGGVRARALATPRHPAPRAPHPPERWRPERL